MVECCPAYYIQYSHISGRCVQGYDPIAGSCIAEFIGKDRRYMLYRADNMFCPGEYKLKIWVLQKIRIRARYKYWHG
jgi:hypothetical protein